jgi:uncharacterized protein YcfL
LQNTGASSQRFYYKIDWLDQGGARIDVPSPPVPWTVRAKEIASLFVSAPTPLAKSFRIVFVSRP